MKTLEIAVAALLIISWISIIFRLNQHYRWLIVLTAVTAVTVVVQLAFEKIYWQMLPIYAFVILVLIISLIQFFEKSRLSNQNWEFAYYEWLESFWHRSSW